MKLNNRIKFYLIGILLLVVALACGSEANTSRQPQQDNPVSDPAVSVTSIIYVTVEEFNFTLDADQAQAGVVTFVVTNEGNMPHDFAISGEGIEEKTVMIDPGETVELEVTLEPGNYEYACTVPGHAMLGMRGEFSVTS